MTGTRECLFDKKERRSGFNIFLAVLAAAVLLMTGFFCSVKRADQPLFYSSYSQQLEADSPAGGS